MVQPTFHLLSYYLIICSSIQQAWIEYPLSYHIRPPPLRGYTSFTMRLGHSSDPRAHLFSWSLTLGSVTWLALADWILANLVQQGARNALNGWFCPPEHLRKTWPASSLLPGGRWVSDKWGRVALARSWLVSDTDRLVLGSLWRPLRSQGPSMSSFSFFYN